MTTSAVSRPYMPPSWSTVIGAGLTRYSFSWSSAPGANAHVAEAQLPAYCRIDGRKDTRSGRRLPSTGKNSSPARVTASSQGDMSPSPYPSGIRMAEEQERRAEREQDVPLQRDRERERRGYKEMEADHDRRSQVGHRPVH